MNAAWDFGVVRKIRIIVWTCGEWIRSKYFTEQRPYLLIPKHLFALALPSLARVWALEHQFSPAHHLLKSQGLEDGGGRMEKNRSEDRGNMCVAASVVPQVGFHSKIHIKITTRGPSEVNLCTYRHDINSAFDDHPHKCRLLWSG